MGARRAPRPLLIDCARRVVNHSFGVICGPRGGRGGAKDRNAQSTPKTIRMIGHVLAMLRLGTYWFNRNKAPIRISITGPVASRKMRPKFRSSDITLPSLQEFQLSGYHRTTNTPAAENHSRTMSGPRPLPVILTLSAARRKNPCIQALCKFRKTYPHLQKQTKQRSFVAFGSSG